MHYEPFHLERFFAAHEFATPHLLTVSDCETRTIGDLLTLEPDAEVRFRALPLGYTPSEGGLELRDAIAATYGPTIEPAAVLVHATAVEGVYTLCRALLEPGDRVVVQMPAYQALRSAAQLAGATLVPWWGRPTHGWAPDLDELDGLLADASPRILVLNTPHNPTGWQADEAFLSAVLDRAESHGVRVFCDEAYRGTGYGSAPIPSAVDLSGSAVALGLVSKGLGLPGLRTGWLVSQDQATLARIAGYKDFTSICGSAPSEFLAALALRHSHLILDETRKLLARNLALLDAFMERQRAVFDWPPPLAGPVTFPRLSEPRRWGGAESFCTRARVEAGVLLAPGSLFGAGPGQATCASDRAVCESVRIGFGRASFPTALAAFEDWLGTS